MNLFVKIGCYAAAAVFAAFLLKMEGTPVQIIIAAIGAFAVIMTIITIIQQREDKKSFTDAQRLKDGRIFTSEKESLRYEKWLERRKPQFPGKNMRSDLIARFRRPRIAAELFGAFALVPVLLILFKERSEGKEEPGVIYIVIGGMILLVCLAAAEIFGVKARRFYLCFTDRPDFRLIEQDYMRSEIIGQPAEWLSLGGRYLILMTPKYAVAVPRSEVSRVCRAQLLKDQCSGAALTDGDVFFIRVYTASGAAYFIHMSKFNTQYAFDLLERSGLPADSTIEIR